MNEDTPPSGSPRRGPLLWSILAGIALVAGGSAVVWSSCRKRPGVASRDIPAPVIDAVSMGAYGRALENAQRVSAKAMAFSLEFAIVSYEREYGELPPGPAHLKTDSTEGLRLLSVLLAKETGRPRNFRGLIFLELDDRDHGRDGSVPSAEALIKGLHDPWGNPYLVELDTEFAEKLHFQAGNEKILLANRTVAVHSAGPDRQEGTGDDIRSW